MRALPRQAVAIRSARALSPKAAAIATGSVKDPSLPRPSPAEGKPSVASKSLNLPGSTAAEKARALLSNPDYGEFLAKSRAALVRDMHSENLDFLLDLKRFRANPSLAMALELKKTYIDAGNEEIDMTKLDASDLGKDFSSKGLNITAHERKVFNEDFDSCKKAIDRGESAGRSGIGVIFRKVEEQAAKLLLKELKIF